MEDERIIKYFALCAIKVGNENHLLSKPQLESLFSKHEILVYFDIDQPDLVVKNGGSNDGAPNTGTIVL